MIAARHKIAELFVCAELFGSYSAKKLRDTKKLRDHARGAPGLRVRNCDKPGKLRSAAQSARSPSAVPVTWTEF
jgi:hypothetical protein